MSRLFFRSGNIAPAGERRPTVARGSRLLLLVVLISLLGNAAAFATVPPIVVESYQADCSTQSDSFPRPATVCAKVTGIPGPYPKGGRIKWWAPGLDPALDAATLSLPFSTGTGTSWDIRTLSDCGTWIVRVFVPTGTFQDEDTFELTGCNNPPVPGTITGDGSALEGSTHAYHSTASDLEGDPLTYAWSIASGTSIASITAGQGTPTVELTFSDDGVVTLHLSVSDPTHPAVSPADASVTVENVAPALTIASPAGGTPYAVNDTVEISGTFTDPGTGDTHTCAIAWDDGTSSAGSVDDTSGTCGAARTFASAGTYTISMTVTDDDGAPSSQAVMVVVYDPDAGFVNGGGWFKSPAGAYSSDEARTGRVRFSFVSRYSKGATSPTGQVEIRSDAGDLDFRSAGDQHWLVVSGADAQYRGYGTVSGESGYGFLLTAHDGDQPGGDGVDRIRVKIWGATGDLVYDNAAVASDDMDSAAPQPIGGGNISVHAS